MQQSIVLLLLVLAGLASASLNSTFTGEYSYCITQIYYAIDLVYYQHTTEKTKPHHPEKVNQIPIRSIATSCCFFFIFGPSQFLCAGNKNKNKKKKVQCAESGSRRGRRTRRREKRKRRRRRGAGMTYLHQNPPPPNKIKIFLGKILFSPPSSSCPAGAPRNFFHCARLRPVDMNTTKKDIRS